MDVWRWRHFCILLLLLMGCCNLVNGKLRIIELKVPSTIELGSKDEVILDCEFEASADEHGLEVKWFYGGGGDEQIYQWIPQRSKPQALGSLRDRIDVNYKASNDPATMHRALRISGVTADLSGDYMCKITSFENEDTATKRMTIYEPAKEFDFIHMEDEDKVICSASGVLPLPLLTITMLHSNGSVVVDDNDVFEPTDTADDDDDEDIDDEINVDLANVEMNDEPVDVDDDNNNVDEESETQDNRDFILVENDDKTFNLTRVLSYKEGELLGVTKFVCELSIPDTTYAEKRFISKYSGNFSMSTETQIQSEFDYNDALATNATETAENGSCLAVADISLLLTTFLLLIFSVD